MSLTLRQHCEPVLDEHLLSGFYADMDHSRRMSLNNDCGGTVITVPSITFSRTNPTIKECEYAAQLLNTFLHKNGKAINELIEQADILDSMPNPESDQYLLESKKLDVKMEMSFKHLYKPQALAQTQGFGFYSLTLTFINHKRQERATFVYDKNLVLISFSCHGIKESAISTELKDMKFYFDEVSSYYKEAVTHIASKEDWYKQSHKVRELRNKLNSCKVSL